MSAWELYTLRVYIGRRDGQEGRKRRRAISLGLTWFLSCGKSADEDGLEPGFNDRYVSEDGSIEKSCA